MQGKQLPQQLKISQRVSVLHNRKSKLFRNATAMIAVQVVGNLVPLATLPYLARTLKPEAFGVLSLGVALISVAHIFTDLGIGLSGAYNVSKHRERTRFVNSYISSALFCKLCSLFVVVLVFHVMLPFIPYVSENRRFMIFLIFPFILDAMSPTWIFQGIEKLVILAVLSLAGRLLYLAFIFLFITSPDDIVRMPLIILVGQAVPVVFGYIVLCRSGISLAKPSRRLVRITFLNAQNYFYSRLAIASYTSLGTIFLSTTTAAATLGAFSAAQQVYKALQQITAASVGALLPYMARERDRPLLKKIAAVSIVFTIIVSCGVSSFANEVSMILFGPEFPDAYFYLRLFLLAYVFDVIAAFTGHALFATYGIAGRANKTFWFAGGTNLLLLTALWVSGILSPMLACFSLLLAEIAGLIYRYILLLRYSKEVHSLK